jgi:sugar O-acyltransferase (sialic acid O-acetyltransferase NeuD family)
VVVDAAQLAGKWSHFVFYDDRWPMRRGCAGFDIGGNSDAIREQLSAGWPAETELIVAIGENVVRMMRSREFSNAGARLATVVHPSAVVSQSARLGPGTVVLAHAVINPSAAIGASCIVNTGAVIDHGVTIGDGVHLCPGVAIAGDVSVGDMAFVGIGSCVIQGIQIGSRAIIGAGSVVIRDVEPGSVVVGNPARRT